MDASKAENGLGGDSALDVDKSQLTVRVLGMNINKMAFCAFFILGVEACERMTYYSYLASIKPFFKKRTHIMGEQQTTQVINAFTIVCYAMPILGGYLANSKLGTYWCIVGFVTWYVIGSAMVAISAHPSVNSGVLALIGMMVFVAVGTGGIKPNICVFGGDQYDATTPLGKKGLDQFWAMFYLCINAAALLSFGVFGTMATDGMGSVSAKWGYFVVYVICFFAMLLALLTFLSGSVYYVKKGSSGDCLVGLTHYIVEDAKNTVWGKASLAGWLLMIAFIVGTFVLAFFDNFAAGCIMAVIGLVACTTVIVCHLNNNRISNCKPCKHLARSEASAFLDTIPIQIVANVSFNFAYNMMNGPFNDQTCLFDLRIHGSSQVNGSVLNVADSIAIVIFIPITEYLIYPMVKRVFGYEVIRRDKIIMGFGFAIIALAIAIIAEKALNSASYLDPPIDSNCSADGTNMKNISFAWMILPFMFIGLGEIMINPVVMGFVYEQIPFRTRNFSQAFNCLCLASIPSAFYVPIQTMLNKYYDNHKSYIYAIGIIICLVAIPVYLYIYTFFVHKDFSDDKIYSDDEDFGVGIDDVVNSSNVLTSDKK